jgi:hypothetical protein
MIPVELRIIGDKEAVKSALIELLRHHGDTCRLHGLRRGKKGDFIGRATLHVRS